MTACDLIASLAGHVRVDAALGGLAGLLYGVLGLALLGWRRLARPDRRRGHGIVAVPRSRVGLALVVLGLLVQGLGLAAGECR